MARQFTSTDDYILAGDHALPTPTGSIFIWFYSTGATDIIVPFSQTDETTFPSVGMDMYWFGGEAVMRWISAGGFAGQVTVTGDQIPNAWNSWAGTWDSIDGMFLRFNGVQDHNGAIPNLGDNTGVSRILGNGHSLGNAIVGNRIGEVSIYDYVLTPGSMGQMAALESGSISPLSLGPVHYWPLCDSGPYQLTDLGSDPEDASLFGPIAVAGPSGIMTSCGGASTGNPWYYNQQMKLASQMNKKTKKDWIKNGLLWTPSYQS